MKIPAMVAVMVLGAASMWAQAAPAAAPEAAPAATSAAAPAAPDTTKPSHHMSCTRDKMANKGMKKHCHCMRNKGGKMSKEMDGNKKGSCPRMKKEAVKQS